MDSITKYGDSYVTYKVSKRTAACMRCGTFALLCLFLIVSQNSVSEELHTCSTVNARPVLLDKTWALMRDDGKVLTTEPYCDAGEYSDGLIRFELCSGSNKSFRYLTPEGKLALTVAAAAAGDFSEGLVPIQNEHDLWGYMNSRGETVISPRFQEARAFSEELAPVRVDDQWHYINRTGQIVLTPQVEGSDVISANSFKSGAALVVLYDKTTKDYKKGLIDHAGKWLVNPIAGLISELHNGLAAFESNTGKTGFMDEKGRVRIQPRFTDSTLLPFQEGLAAVYVGNGAEKKAGFINKNGEWVVQPRFDAAYHFCGGLAPVKVNERWGYVNKNGILEISPRYDHAESFEGGIAEVYEQDENQALHREFINQSGSVLFRSAEASSLTIFEE